MVFPLVLEQVRDLRQHPLREKTGVVTHEVSRHVAEVEQQQQVSYVQVLVFEGQEVMRTTFDSVDYNPAVDAASFEKPEA